MIDHDDARFSSFTRDLARRQRRPRSYPPAPMRQDVLEQLCGGGSVPAPTNLATLASLAGVGTWSDETEQDTLIHESDFDFVGTDEPS